jgi:hypothetical protein
MAFQEQRRRQTLSSIERLDCQRLTAIGIPICSEISERVEVRSYPLSHHRSTCILDARA